jgi:hypothetical protein
MPESPSVTGPGFVQEGQFKLTDWLHQRGHHVTELAQLAPQVEAEMVAEAVDLWSITHLEGEWAHASEFWHGRLVPSQNGHTLEQHHIH